MILSNISNESLMKYLNLKKIKDQNISIWITITGNCMSPWFVAGDKVHIISKPDYFIGDNVLKYQHGHFWVHRIVHVLENTVITKGDHNDFSDEELQKNDIVGVVVGKRNISGTEIIFKHKRALIIKVAATFSYWSGILNHKYVHKSNNVQKKVLKFLYVIFKFLSQKFFYVTYKLSIRPCI